MIDAAVREELRRAETDEELLDAVVRVARSTGALVRDLLLDLGNTGAFDFDQACLAIVGRHPSWIGLRTRPGLKVHLAVVSHEVWRETVPLRSNSPACRPNAEGPAYDLSWHFYGHVSHRLASRDGCRNCYFMWIRSLGCDLRTMASLQARSAGLLPAECAAGIHTGNLVTRTGDPYTRCADCEAPLS